MAKEYIEREAVCYQLEKQETIDGQPRAIRRARRIVEDYPAAGVVPVSEVEKIIERLQEQADLYNARANELLVEEDGQVPQYTWAVSLRETYRRIIKTLDDLIS